MKLETDYKETFFSAVSENEKETEFLRANPFALLCAHFTVMYEPMDEKTKTAVLSLLAQYHDGWLKGEVVDFKALWEEHRKSLNKFYDVVARAKSAGRDKP